MQPKRLGNCGWYFNVLKWASENGLSFEVCGLLCDLVTPRSASSKAVAPRLRKGKLGFHRPATIGMQRQLAGRDRVLGDGIIEQFLEPGVSFSLLNASETLGQGSAFSIGHTPADDAPAEDIKDHIQVEIGPFRWSHPSRFASLAGANETLVSLVISHDQTWLGASTNSSGF